KRLLGLLRDGPPGELLGLRDEAQLTGDEHEPVGADRLRVRADGGGCPFGRNHVTCHVVCSFSTVCGSWFGKRCESTRLNGARVLREPARPRYRSTGQRSGWAASSQHWRMPAMDGLGWASSSASGMKRASVISSWSARSAPPVMRHSNAAPTPCTVS